jgi:hypothetical protein
MGVCYIAGPCEEGENEANITPGHRSFWRSLDGFINQRLPLLYQLRGLCNLILNDKLITGDVIFDLLFIHPLLAALDYGAQLCQPNFGICGDPVVSIV